MTREKKNRKKPVYKKISLGKGGGRGGSGSSRSEKKIGPFVVS